jgi:hypothetical protein
MSKTEATIKTFETRVSGKGSPKESIWIWRWAGERNVWMVSSVPIEPGMDVEIMGEYVRK